MSTSENKAALSGAVNDFNDPSRRASYLQFYADDAVVSGLAPEPLRGMAAIGGFYEQMWRAFPNARVELGEQVAEGDRVAARFVVTGIHLGEFMGILPTGRPVTMSGMSIFRFAGGRCVERWNQADFLGLLQQLGAIPATNKPTPPGDRA